MLALAYLAVMVITGHYICRQFYRSLSLMHNIAGSFLVGLLFSTWITYMGASAFAWSPKPLFWGNLIFFITSAIIIYKTKDMLPSYPTTSHVRILRAEILDWLTIVVCLAITCWLMFSTFYIKDGVVFIGHKVSSDFGPNIALIQNFALGHNFPTEYPHFPGDSIRYHFLFWFQAGNLEFLGLRLDWSLNLLSILSIISMLMLVMVMGEVVFNTRAVGRIAALLFFFHGSLSYFVFFNDYNSIQEAINAVLDLNVFLPSGYPFRGESWGVWSMAVFVNQRHFTSGIGIMILVVIFLISLIKKDFEITQGCDYVAAYKGDGLINKIKPSSNAIVFSGVLIGLLPMWNGAVFISALIVMGAMFLTFRRRIDLFYAIVTSVIVGLPQILFLRPENNSATLGQSYPIFYWGFILDDPTISNVTKYLGFTFGFKWVFIFIALLFVRRFQRLVFLILLSLLATAFLIQFSVEVLANHKFINIWLIFVNLFVGYGFCRLWNLRIFTKPLAILILLVILPGGIIDIFPIYNDLKIEMGYEKDSLMTWLLSSTDPKDIFLSDTYVNHPILLAGRRIYYGHSYFAWSAGHNTDQRESLYEQMITETNFHKLLKLLQNNKIDYVAVDDGFRTKHNKQIVNEHIYQENFEKVYEDSSNKYGSLIIYKVPRCELLNIKQ